MSEYFHPRAAAGMAAVVLAMLLGAPSAPAAEVTGGGDVEITWQAKVDPRVLESAARFGVTDFFAFLDRQADIGRASTLETKEEKGAIRLRAADLDSSSDATRATGTAHRAGS